MRRSSSSASWIDSTIHSNISVKYDVNASALSVDATGSVGVLAGRKGLYVIDLESPYQPARTLHHQTKWDVTVVKCNPHVLYKGVVASTSNHNTLLWNIDYNTSSHVGGGVLSSHQPLMSTLRAHTRPVSDVAWSPSEPTVLASSSADTTTHLWDIRTPRKPAQSLCAFTTSATQVEWNRLDAFSLATAHAGEVFDFVGHKDLVKGFAWRHQEADHGNPTGVFQLISWSKQQELRMWKVDMALLEGCGLAKSYPPTSNQNQNQPPHSSDWIHILDCANLCHHSSMLITTPDVHAATAAAAGNIEQAQMWSILSVSTGLDSIDGSSLHLPPWHAHPFGSSLVRHMLELYESAGDVSTLAAIVCAVHLSQPPPPSPSSARRLVMEAPATRTTSSSSTDSIDDNAVLSPGRSSTAKDQPNLSPLLDRSDLARYDGYKRAQADLLYRQGATNARCDLLKHLHTPSDPHVGLTLAVYCCHCGRVRQTRFG
ncbi:hypothetical protein DYB35_005362 [Aphanomyces astaci]|uniref:Uncharacterized protein n=1 Tax=Aphanomyces astaci TaxID=112090 RepID=A0A3R7ACR0_APHAT|nr:hypothetical protein DYB35_005362 [Aphanomyces astaci]